MPVVVVVGAQWGDEGKGKIVDLYTSSADMVVRYGGGANAGHTLVVGGSKIVLHLVPSGAMHTRVRCVLGQGTVIDPAVLLAEMDELDRRGLSLDGRLVVSDRAHLVLPHHYLIDALREKGTGALGTTRRGIGPAYEDKIGRRGVRVGDLVDHARFIDKLATALDAWQPTLEALGGEAPAAAATAEDFFLFGDRLRAFVGDAGREIARAMASGQNILFEGAQGTLLDIDHGTYPFVTSSSTVAGGACTGAGIGPTAIDAVVGISKAYATRVGSGPFPTEISGELGERLREAGGEFGATTGRPRRCGWLDVPALRYAVRVNGLSAIALTKLDVLTGLPEIPMCLEYELDGDRLDEPPYDGLDRVQPVYDRMPGWTEKLAAARTLADLPEAARRYVARIEKEVGAEIVLVSVGADREETILLRDIFAS